MLLRCNRYAYVHLQRWCVYWLKSFSISCLNIFCKQQQDEMMYTVNIVTNVKGVLPITRYKPTHERSDEYISNLWVRSFIRMGMPPIVSPLDLVSYHKLNPTPYSSSITSMWLQIPHRKWFCYCKVKSVWHSLRTPRCIYWQHRVAKHFSFMDTINI